MNSITIFTPAYNRAYILHELYQSLVRQTSQDFEWLIVDDGSSDNTEELVASWITAKMISIRYFKQANAGKMAAHNRGVELCTTPLFVCVDSDDFLADDAVETILHNKEFIIGNSIAGMIAYKGSNKETPIGNDFPTNLSTFTLSGLYSIGFKGDTTLVFKTEVLKKYPFPIIKNEKFITEAYIYDQIDIEYKYYLVPKVLTICEYRSDGLTLNGMKLVFNNPGGWALYCCQKGNFSSKIKKQFKDYAWAISYMLMKHDSSFELHPCHKLVFYLAFPYGALLYLRRIYKYRGQF